MCDINDNEPQKEGVYKIADRLTDSTIYVCRECYIKYLKLNGNIQTEAGDIDS